MSKPVSSNATVFRAISHKRWIKDAQVAPDAFFLRPAKNDRKAETELSMLTQANCSMEICFAGLDTCFGEIEIKVESIKQLGLDIIDDSEKLGIPYHASIINLPPHEGNTLAQAEFFAGELAKRFVQIKVRPKILK
ncbi:MAG: hypothetical protein M3367_00085 [Acidobacteriota bacterium]|nr:hypothetical protein [Acidobacteriota bacterium]